MSLPEREVEIYKEISAGNVPSFLRRLCPVTVTNVFEDNTNRATYFVTPDYLAIGSDDDYFLTAMSPNTAQRIADLTGCTLPTRKIVNDIYRAADLKLEPTPIPPGPAMTTVAVFSNHNAIVWTQRMTRVKEQSLGALTAGHQKDVVLSGALPTARGKVAIYGWHKTNGAPIQPLYLGHTASWVDYSQCIRLVQQKFIVNGETKQMSEVLADPVLSVLLSDEGTLSDVRYATDLPAELPAKGTPVARGAEDVSTNAIGVRGFSGFKETGAFGERAASFRFEPEVAIEINAPSSAAGQGRSPLLVFYALPNGNTIEQTIGRALQAGDDWRFDIQHIGAQTRYLRELLPQRMIFVAYLQANQKSWPAWRKKHEDSLLPKVLGAVSNIVATELLARSTDTNVPGSSDIARDVLAPMEIVLTGHSGGGSLMFGYINAVERIPDYLRRIAFLDSNYGYDRALGHREKLTNWLKARQDHYLCVLAYNDAIALLDGKPFVSAAGGTWGRSHAMLEDLEAEFKFASRTNAALEHYTGLGSQIKFVLKQNPERKIYHTLQVERNGFIHSMVCGTTNEERGYTYFGERAYGRWIK